MERTHLVLTRKPGQGIKIGDSIIVIEAVKNREVKVSVHAPREVRIVREELEPLTSDA